MSIFKSLSVAAALATFAPVAASAATSPLETLTIDYTDGGSTGGELINTNTFSETFAFTTNFPDYIISSFNIILEVQGVDRAPGADLSGPATSGEGQFTVYDPNSPTSNTNIGGAALDGALNDGTENWFASIAGQNASGTIVTNANHAFWKRITPDALRSDDFFTFELSAADDDANNSTGSSADRVDGIANTAFQRSVSDNEITLRFRERSGGTDEFTLLSASIEVYGVAAPIPVPASGLLLLGAVGGVAAWKRRKAS